MSHYLVSNGEHMRRHGPQALALVGLDGGAGVEVPDVLVRVDGNQDVCHVGVDLVFGISVANQLCRS